MKKEKALTVSELITILENMDPNAEVREERAGEHRRLTSTDITYGTDFTLYDADEGEVLEDIEDPVVVFGAWD